MDNTMALLLSDTYKQCHDRMYPKGLKKLVSYWVPRKSMLEKQNKMVFFGLQAFVKNYLLDFFKNIGRRIKGAWNNSASIREKIVAFCSATGKWTYKLRGLVLAIPVIVISIILAVSNMATLPAAVAIGLPNIVNGIFILFSLSKFSSL